MIDYIKKNKIIIALVLFVITIFTCLTLPVNIVKAENVTGYSDILEDLQKDEDFDIKKYPIAPKDYTLSVIQVAESKDKEVFIYVYQPSAQYKNYVASYIKLATDSYADYDDEVNFNVYSLTLCNNYSTLYKYKVNGLSVEDSIRYYNITSIYRPFDRTVDEQASYDNKVTHVDFDVCKKYIFEDKDGETIISCNIIETVTITDKFVGFVRYSGGLDYFWVDAKDCDNHFIAFNTDRPIDSIIEADIFYNSQTYESFGKPAAKGLGSVKENKVTLNSEDKESFRGKGLFSIIDNRWEKIQTVESFIESVNKENIYNCGVFNVSVGSQINDESYNALKDKKWVLRFTSTSFNEGITTVAGAGSVLKYNGTIISDATILRLKFMYDDKVYNLGVLDNMQKGSDEPINETIFSFDSDVNWKLILTLILIVLLIIILSPVLPFVIQAVIWLISSPIKAIKNLIKNFKKAKEKDKEKGDNKEM